jgi:hypothetical protein
MLRIIIVMFKILITFLNESFFNFLQLGPYKHTHTPTQTHTHRHLDSQTRCIHLQVFKLN